jgi:hypothetical protein
MLEDVVNCGLAEDG